MKENNKFLMIGLGKSGLAMIDYLDSLGKNILAYDNNKDLKIRIQDYKNVEFYIGKNDYFSGSTYRFTFCEKIY